MFDQGRRLEYMIYQGATPLGNVLKAYVLTTWN